MLFHGNHKKDSLWRTYLCGMESRYQDFIRDVLITVHMNLRELRERKSFADGEELTHIEAKLLAYEEMLLILRDSADQFKIPKRELGL